jgi:hypothetical protein
MFGKLLAVAQGLVIFFKKFPFMGNLLIQFKKASSGWSTFKKIGSLASAT